MEIRIATPNDEEDLLVLSEYFESDTTAEHIRQSLVENDREVVCIAFVGGAAAGYACALIVKSMFYSDDRADIEALYVRDEFRRQGIGEGLMKCLEDALVERGVRHFHITTGAENTSAQSLYRKLGYMDTGEILLDKSV